MNTHRHTFACVLSCVWLFARPWTVARQAPLFMEFPRQEYWSELPFPPPRDLPDPGIKPKSPAAPALAGGFFTTKPPGKPVHGLYSPWISPGQNTVAGSCSLLQRIFSTQGSNPGLLHCRQILYQPSHQGSPRLLEWVACPFSSGSSRPRNQTIKLGSPALQANSLPVELTGKLHTHTHTHTHSNYKKHWKGKE